MRTENEEWNWVDETKKDITTMLKERKCKKSKVETHVLSPSATKCRNTIANLDFYRRFCIGEKQRHRK